MNERGKDHNKELKLAGDNKNTLICTRFDLICESQTPFIRVISSADQSHGNTRFLRLTWECLQNIILRSASKTQRDEVRHMLDIDPFIFKIYERIFIFLAKQRSFWYIYTLKAAWLLFGVDVWQNGGDEYDLFEMWSHQGVLSEETWGSDSSKNLDEKITDLEIMKK